MSLELEPSLCVGGVMHARHWPVAHRFAYRLAWVRLPLSRLGQIGNALFGVERMRLFSFHNRDHGARDGSALLPWIRALLARHGLAEACDGEVVLQTFPRLLGFVFNPVSFWFCHDRRGALRAVLCEVNNTFGERHSYLVAHPDQRPIRSEDRFRSSKVFHVSPFFPVRGEYEFNFVERAGVCSVSIDLFDAGHHQISTRISGRMQPLAAGGLARVAARFPLMTLGVVARIHWQALKLLLKGVRFHRKPLPPLEETTS
ncbi:DUF1365 domain-containing protein [Niveibacterium umoris]|uniref:DUF1365 domain-containing protein n=1 Tax=Niveibacterium umoris TaxID=1193620 RepID=A0A840BHH9_9RHOO|nr:DUF1365 domain-containing protein [Niveibacterium umoris]MBB4012685.1 hypothetical protein [Niveibacterium umoris]